MGNNFTSKERCGGLQKNICKNINASNLQQGCIACGHTVSDKPLNNQQNAHQESSETIPKEVGCPNENPTHPDQAVSRPDTLSINGADDDDDDANLRAAANRLPENQVNGTANHLPGNRVNCTANLLVNQISGTANHVPGNQVNSSANHLHRNQVNRSARKDSATRCVASTVHKEKLTLFKIAKCYSLIVIIFICQLALTVVLVVSALHFNVAGVRSLVSESWQKKGSEMCVLCTAEPHEAATKVSNEKIEKFRKNDHELICCSQNHTVLQQLFGEYTRKYYETELQNLGHRGSGGLKLGNTSELQSSNTQCAAHLFLHPDSSRYLARGQQRPSDYVHLHGWVDKGEAAYRRSCITYDPAKGQFRVDQSGFYVIYCHLAFVAGTTLTRGSFENKEVVYSQRIHDNSSILHSETQGVVVNIDTFRTNVPVHSSAVVFSARLHKGDAIWVEARPAELLHRVNGASYFGLFRLDFD